MVIRVLVAAVGPIESAIGEARKRRDDGLEVVYAGGGLDLRQIAHIVRAEDVRQAIVVATTDVTDPLLAELAALGIDDTEVVALVSSSAHG